MMNNERRIRLFDFGKTDFIFFGVLILLALLVFHPSFAGGLILLPFPDDIYMGTGPGYGYDTPSPGGIPPGHDVNLEIQPWNDYACERLKNGHIPFWNPYNCCGTPFFANSLNQLTYIPRLLFSLVLSTENVITALAIMHFLLCGLGCYYLLKAYRVSSLAAGFAAFLLLFKFSHPTIMMMPPLALALAFTPICLLLAVKLVRGARWLGVLYLAICLSCMLSSGYPIFVIHFIYLGIALIIYEHFKLRKSARNTPRGGIWKIIAAVAFSILFSLTQLLPLAHFYALSARPAISRLLITHFHLDFTQLGFIVYHKLLMPFQPDDPIYGATADYSNLYIGIIPVLLALPLYGQWRRKSYSFFILAAAAAGILSFSPTIFYIAMRIAPGFGLSPVPPLPVFYFCLAMAVGLTLDHLGRPENLLAGRHVFAAVIFILVFSIIALVAPLPGSEYRQAFYPLVFTGSMFLILIGLLIKRYINNASPLFAIVLIALSIKLVPPMVQWTNFHAAPNSMYLRCKDAGQALPLGSARYFDATGSAFLSADTNIYPRIRLVQGYDSLVLKSFSDYYEAHIPKGVIRGRRLTARRGEAPEQFLREAGVGKVIVHPEDMPSARVEEICGMELYVSDVSCPECTISSGSCSMNRISPEKIVITIETDGNAELKIAEAYYPAWRYRFDGEIDARRIHATDAGFMKIPDIPPGTTKVELFYNPWLEKLGLILAALSFIIGVFLSVILGRKKQSKTPGRLG